MARTTSGSSTGRATLLDDEKGAQKNPPETKCCKSAPPVLKFDPEGNLLASWGGPTAGQPWVKNEHGIHVDRDGNVWLGGNNDGDQILKFTPEGKFLQQIGKDDGIKGSSSQTRLGRPAHMMTDREGSELYVADGYGNHRVVVFDAKTGAFKRMWGAYGKPPSDEKMPAVPGRRQAVGAVRQSCALRALVERRPASMSATAPTTASRCSRRTAAS